MLIKSRKLETLVLEIEMMYFKIYLMTFDKKEIKKIFNEIV